MIRCPGGGWDSRFRADGPGAHAEVDWVRARALGSAHFPVRGVVLGVSCVRRFLVVGVASVLALAGAELFLRLFAPVDFQRPDSGDDATVWTSLIHQPSSIPGLDYEIAPDRWGSSAHRRAGINAHGFRGPPPIEPKAGTRIVVLGDSFTFGLGVILPPGELFSLY